MLVLFFIFASRSLVIIIIESCEPHNFMLVGRLHFLKSLDLMMFHWNVKGIKLKWQNKCWSHASHEGENHARQIWKLCILRVGKIPVEWLSGYPICKWAMGFACALSRNPLNFYSPELVCRIRSWLRNDLFPRQAGGEDILVLHIDRFNSCYRFYNGCLDVRREMCNIEVGGMEWIRLTTRETGLLNG